MTEHTTVIEPDVDERRGPANDNPTQTRPSPATRVLGQLTAPSAKLNPSAGVWAGLAVAALGFGLIFFSWLKVAALLDVGRQMPYVVSGAMSGLGLIVVGIAVVDMAVRRQDRLERRQQLSMMRAILEELRNDSPSSQADRS